MKALVLILSVLLFFLPSLVDGKIRAGLELILYLPFDEGVGKKTEELSEFGNDGQLEGNCKWVDGKFGKALYFITQLGEPGLVRTSKHDIFAIEGKAEITLMAWVNVDASRPGFRAIVYNRPDANKVNYALGLWAVDVNFFYRDKENDNFHRVTGIWDAVKLGEWTHVAATNTFGDPEAMKVYLNGKEQPSNKNGGVRPDHWSQGDGAKMPLPARGPVTVGGYGNFSDTFQGAIDEVMIWKGSFTEAEINEIMAEHPTEFLAVDPREKLATKWAAIKRNL